MGGISADQLEIPAAAMHAWKAQGMRAVVAYDVKYDGIVVRFDTIFEGAQYNIAYYLHDHHNDARAEAESRIPFAVDAWSEGQWARGRIIWFANDPRL